MSWTTILTMLVLAITTAMLEMFFELALWESFAVVSGVAIFLLLGLLAMLLRLSPPQDRLDLWALIKTEMRKELKAMFVLIRGK